MITVNQIHKIIEEKIEGTEKFIVYIGVKPNNRITVEIDSPQGININDCTALHRFIESKLNRDLEDFELTVSSPGMEESFKVFRQYEKNVGRKVRVILKDGRVAEGKLSAVEANMIGISGTKKEKKHHNERGRPEIIEKIISIPLEEIKQTKLLTNQ